MEPPPGLDACHEGCLSRIRRARASGGGATVNATPDRREKHRPLESRVRENCTHGSEGGAGHDRPYPYRREASLEVRSRDWTWAWHPGLHEKLVEQLQPFGWQALGAPFRNLKPTAYSLQPKAFPSC